MSFESIPKCTGLGCNRSQTTMWRMDDTNGLICNTCYSKGQSVPHPHKEDSYSVISDSDSMNSGSNSGLRTALCAVKSGGDTGLSKDVASCYYVNVRKSSRIKPQPKPQKQSKSNAGKGKNRRFVFKRSVSSLLHPNLYCTILILITNIVHKYKISIFYAGYCRNPSSHQSLCLRQSLVDLCSTR